MAGGTRRDVEKLVQRLASEHGCAVSQGRSNHWRVTLPGRHPVFLSRSPSDARALSNMKRDIRRHLGIEL